MTSGDDSDDRDGDDALFARVYTELKNLVRGAQYGIETDDGKRHAPGRFGAHQFQEFMQDTLVYCAWFAGGLRVVDVADGAHFRH